MQTEAIRVFYDIFMLCAHNEHIYVHYHDSGKCDVLFWRQLTLENVSERSQRCVFE